MRRAGLLASAVAVVALVTAPLAVLADGQPPSLDEVIAAALSGSPDMVAARADLARADAQVSQAQAAGRGTVRLHGQVALAYSDFGPGYGSITPRTVALGYERTLYDGGATQAGLTAARAGQTASTAQQALVRTQLGAAVAGAWMQLAVASASVTRSQALLAAVTRLERDATLQFEAGEVPRSVMAQATARRAQAEAGLEEAGGAREIARSHLARLSGLEVEVAALPMRLPPIPPDLDSARALLPAHPALAAARAEVDAARATITQAEGRSGPVAVGSLRAVHVRDEVLPGYRNDGLEAQVRVSVPLWDGGARQASVAATRADLQAAEARRDGLMRQLEDSLRRAFAARSTAQGAVRAAAAQAEASRIALTSLEAEFRAGERPLIDVLDALAELASAEAAHHAARAAFLLSHWQINAALGREVGAT